MAKTYTLQKHERLKSKKLLDSLFAEGHKGFAYPLRLLYSIDECPEGEWPLLFSVTVPKKKIKSAVTRNLVKRRIREAYRLNKIELQESLQESDYRLSLMLIYIEREPKSYDQLDKAVKKLLKLLQDAIPTS